MIGQWPALALLFGLIFGLNLIPAFAPPTWMALAFVGFEFPETNPLLLALVGAVAATLGRLTLAKLSHWLLRQKLLSEAHRTNIDVIKERLEKRTALTFSLFLFYAFSPRESVYDGKCLSAWLDDLGSPNTATQAQAKEAVRQIGTKQLKTLKKWLEWVPDAPRTVTEEG